MRTLKHVTSTCTPFADTDQELTPWPSSLALEYFERNQPTKLSPRAVDSYVEPFGNQQGTWRRRNTI